VRSFERALRVVPAILGAWGCAGCGAYTVAATSGTVYEQSSTVPDPLSSALRASASRDLPCGSQLLVTRLDDEREYVVAGCGMRGVYRALTPSLMSKRLELVSRSAPAPHVSGVALLGSTPAARDPSASSMTSVAR
jgi:hypothetical protein